MTAYIVTKIEVTDPQAFEEYIERSTATIAQYGGRHIARGADAIILEGDGNTLRNGIIRFDSVDAATRWYNSPEYQEIKKARETCAKAHFYVLDGV